MLTLRIVKLKILILYLTVVINLKLPESYDIILLYLGFIILLATILPRILSRHLITAPIVYLVLAMGVFVFFREIPLPHLAESPYLGKRLRPVLKSKRGTCTCNGGYSFFSIFSWPECTPGNESIRKKRMIYSGL